MPWISERNYLGLISDWGVWDYSDEILTAFVPDNVLILPNEEAKINPQTVTDFLKISDDNLVVIFSHIDPSDCRKIAKEFDNNKVFWSDSKVVCYWEFYSSHNASKIDYREPKFELDFLCYQRKPNHHRPRVYDLLKDRNGIVTLGTMEFDINKDITCSPNMTDVDYIHGNGGPITKTDIDTLGHPGTWDRCFLNIVSESEAHPSDTFISEKTFKPIMGRRPFVTIGATSEYYKTLHDKGYVTFEKDFPDVSDPEKVVELADFLESFDKESYYKANAEKFEHNYRNLCNAKDRILRDQETFIQNIL